MGNKCIWVLSRLYMPNFTGAGFQAQQVYRALVQKGYTVRVMTLALEKARPLARQTLNRDGIEIHYLPALPFLTRKWSQQGSVVDRAGRYLLELVSLLLFYLQSGWRILREAGSSDTVSIYSSKPFAFIIFRLAKWKGMQRVLHLTLLGADDPVHILRTQNSVARLLRLPVFDLADQIVCYSSGQTASCREFGVPQEKLRIIPGAVDLGLPDARIYEREGARLAIGLAADAPVIVFVGSAIPRKGIDILLAMFERVVKVLQDAHLLIVGPFSGPSNEFKTARRLRNEIEREAYAGQVHWVGEVADVSAYLAAGDIFCFPSRREGFGIVIIEAMGAGLPAVVSRLEGITTDIIEDGVDGVLVDGFEPGDYADKVLRLLGDPEAAAGMGAAARAKVERCFGLDRIVRLHQELYA